RGSVGHVPDAIDQEYRAAVDPDVIRMVEKAAELGKVRLPVVASAVDLGLQYLLVLAGPASRPRFVGPAQAERQVGLAVLQHEFERRVKQPGAGEPVMVVAETVDAVLARQVGLAPADGRVREIVVADVSVRHDRLRMTGEQRVRLPHQGPLGEAFAPPAVVLRYPVKLGKMEADGLGFHLAASVTHHARAARAVRSTNSTNARAGASSSYSKCLRSAMSCRW